MKYLHTMVRVGDLDASLDFYCNKLGLVELRRHEVEAGRFTLVFLAAPGDADALAAMAEPVLGGLAANEATAAVAAVSAPYTGGEFVAPLNGSGHAHGVVAFPVPGRASPAAFASMVAAELVGETAPFYVNNEVSLLGAFFDGEDVAPAVAALKAAAKPDADALKAAKSRAKAAFLMSLESNQTALAFLGDAITASGSVLAPADVVKAIDAVDASAVAAVFKDAFAAKPTLLAVSDNLPAYADVVKAL